LYRRAVKLYWAAKHRARTNSVDFDLTVEFIEDKLKLGCQRTGKPFDLKVRSGGDNWSNRKPYSPSLDKRNPNKGYTKRNTQFVAWWYNMAKQRYSDKEILSYFNDALTYKKKKIGKT
jgi:hypothetical protein